ncbi:MAG: hypothetical protein JRG82_08955, partial [Deltaproteobacteria bacterium]|nr:hypothetical protein [Deltaproteobacteria bacterium]
MERQKPDTTSNEIDLYIRTYYSLLRSTGEVRVRSFEEAHAVSKASLHAGAREARPDIAAFGYAAARLPEVMPHIERIVLGQSDETFESFGYDVSGWSELRTRGRRRFLRWDREHTLAAYIASASDIDDLVPIITAYQIEWNKMHELLGSAAPGGASALGIEPGEYERLLEALGGEAEASLAALRDHPLDLRVRLLAGTFSEYQRAANLWWTGVEQAYLRDSAPRRPPVYFVSSNSHSLANLLGGWALAHPERLLPEEDAPHDPRELYFAMRGLLRSDADTLAEVQAWDRESGIFPAENHAHVDVDAQVIEMSRLIPERFDARLQMPGLERLAESDARIINIDYPLGMAAYHLLTRVEQGAGPLLGVYVMGKAATLNGQVGDVIISRVVHDVHSDNTYMLRNSFCADDLAPYLEYGSVLDNQKAVTVRGAFLQNPNYLGVFYREGYTVLEMEAGPYLSAIYEGVD